MYSYSDKFKIVSLYSRVEVLHASFIVTLSIDGVRSHPCNKLAPLNAIPPLLPVILLIIRRTRLLETVCLFTISLFIV